MLFGNHPTTPDYAREDRAGLPYPADAIKIDGTFSVWNSVTPSGPSLRRDPVNWARLRARGTNGTLYLNHDTQANIDFANHAWRYDIFIDSDNDNRSGYHGLPGGPGGQGLAALPVTTPGGARSPFRAEPRPVLAACVAGVPAGWLGQVMNKSSLLEKIVAHLKQQVARFAAAAETSRAEAADEENQAEDKYDTRGLEASYLAAGQSRQMAEMADALQQFATLVPTRFTAATPIDVGALVEVTSKRESALYFIGPAAGGTEITQGSRTVLVLTPQSPLGRQLIGRKKGDRLTLKIGPFTDTYTIASVA